MITETYAYSILKPLVRPANVLLAIDGSPYSSAAAVLVKDLCQVDHAAITVLSVAPDRSISPNEIDIKPGLELDQEKIEARKFDLALAERRAASTFDDLRSSGCMVEARIGRGRASEVILQAAEEVSADLIVIGAKGVGTPHELHLGTTAHKVAHSARCSVLIARPSMRSHFSRIVLGYDGNPGSRHAVEFLTSLTLPPQTEIYVVTVAEEANGYIDNGTGLEAGTFQSIRQSSIDAAKAQVMEGVEMLDGVQTPVFHSVRVGYPSKEILAAARETRADLIVISGKSCGDNITHELGPVAQKIIRRAAGSVLVIK